MEQIPTKTFKEVHAELESEALFLQKNHDVKNFKDKADFLNSIGFGNSIATKLYSAVAQNHEVVAEYQRKYHGQYKFILRPQLERVCEKYNLYVREPGHFLGDIPEKNIKDIMKFRVDINDITNNWEHKERLLRAMGVQNWQQQITLPINSLRDYGFRNLISIAAVKSLFHEDAFKDSQARIIDAPELSAKNQVELDPIVLCKTVHGYLIITAWGDEANDELVVNQNNN